MSGRKCPLDIGRKSEGGLQADPLRNPHGEGPLN